MDDFEEIVKGLDKEDVTIALNKGFKVMTSEQGEQYISIEDLRAFVLECMKEGVELPQDNFTEFMHRMIVIGSLQTVLQVLDTIEPL